MKLHANAELSLKRRRQLARRVVEEGWSLSSAARGRRTRSADAPPASGPAATAASNCDFDAAVAVVVVLILNRRGGVPRTAKQSARPLNRKRSARV